MLVIPFEDETCSDVQVGDVSEAANVFQSDIWDDVIEEPAAVAGSHSQLRRTDKD